MSTLDQFIATTLQAVGRGARALGISSPSSDIDWYRRIYLPGSSELSTAKATHRMVGGIPVPLESDASTEPVIELEQEATQGLCNISRLERKRRLNIAKQFAVMAALMVLGFILAGDSVPRFARFLVWLPLGASVGMGGSAAAGICGIRPRSTGTRTARAFARSQTKPWPRPFGTRPRSFTCPRFWPRPCAWRFSFIIRGCSRPVGEEFAFEEEKEGCCMNNLHKFLSEIVSWRDDLV